MEKEAQKPQIAPPRIRNIGQVLGELGIGPGMPNQAHLNTPKVFLTEEEYLPSESMAKVKNIATLMDATMDKDFIERCQNAKIDPFYISSKDIPLELIDALENLGADDSFVFFRIDREKRTLNPISESQYNGLNPNERGVMLAFVLDVIREGGLPCISFSGTVWWVNYPTYYVGEGPLSVAFTESTN